MYTFAFLKKSCANFSHRSRNGLPWRGFCGIQRFLSIILLFIRTFLRFVHSPAFSPLQMVFAAKRKRTGECSYTLICIDADSGYHTVDRSEQDRSGLVLKAPPSQMTARVPLVALHLLRCLKRQSRMRSRCTNSTQGIKYHHSGIYLLSTELHRGCHTFPRGCRFPGQAAQNPAARNHARTEKLQGSYILVYQLEVT